MYKTIYVVVSVGEIDSTIIKVFSNYDKANEFSNEISKQCYNNEYVKIETHILAE
jgi:hypothetical protein